jgi:hypothetical protein
MHAAQRTNLCFNFIERRELEKATQRWLANKTLEVLLFDHGMLDALNSDLEESVPYGSHGPFDHLDSQLKFAVDLLSDPSTVKNSASSLQVLTNIPFFAAQNLGPFTNLKKLSLYDPLHPDPRHTVPDECGVDPRWVSALSSLTRLSYLTLNGALEEANWGLECFPASLKYLSIESKMKTEREPLRFIVPGSLTNLEALALKAPYVVVDWPLILASCPQIQIHAEHLLFLPDIDGNNSILKFAQQLVQSPVKAERLQLIFEYMTLHSRYEDKIPDFPDYYKGNVDVDELLSVLQQVTAGYYDVDPRILEDIPTSIYGSSVSYGLILEKQPSFEPRSYHFTSPITNREAQILKEHPAWRIVWCKDGRTFELLADADFINLNKHTLTRLSRCYFDRYVDLRPFEALKSLNCTIPSAEVLQKIHFPLGLTSLELEVPRAPLEPEPWRGPEFYHAVSEIAITDRLTNPYRGFLIFDAKFIAGLSSLKELHLTGWYQMNLLELSPSITFLRILNPSVEQSEIGTYPEGPLCYDTCVLPRAMLPQYLSQEAEVGEQERQREDHHLQIAFTDTRVRDAALDLKYLLECKYPWISIDVARPRARGGATLILEVGPSWADFIDLLSTSAVQVLEFNTNGHYMQFVEKDINDWEITNYSWAELWQGLWAIQEQLNDVFDFKTWDGTLQDGIIEGRGHSYRLVRKNKA